MPVNRSSSGVVHPAGVALLGCVLLLAAACTIVPRQEVLPYPDHVKAAIEPGDKVEIILRDGRKISTSVKAVSANAVEGEYELVPLTDIASIAKRSWTPATNPCDDGEPVGCSIPILISVLSEYHAEYGSQFRNPCSKHDYCYEHGLLTYSYSREDCDEQFLDDMRSYCADEYKLDLVTRSECLFAADQMHTAVRLYGEQYYAGIAGQYCEYAGPPLIVLSK